MSALLVWLAGTKAGRIVAAGAALALAIGIALLKAYGAGRAAEKAAAAKGRLEAIRDRRASDAEVDALDADGVRRDLDRWMRD